MITSEYEKLKAVGLTVEEFLFHTAKQAIIKEFNLPQNDDTDKGLFDILGHEVFLTVNAIPEGFKLAAVIDGATPSIWKSKPEATLVFDELANELLAEIKEHILSEAVASPGELETGDSNQLFTPVTLSPEQKLTPAPGEDSEGKSGSTQDAVETSASGEQTDTDASVAQESASAVIEESKTKGKSKAKSKSTDESSTDHGAAVTATPVEAVTDATIPF